MWPYWFGKIVQKVKIFRSEILCLSEIQGSSLPRSFSRSSIVVLVNFQTEVFVLLESTDTFVGLRDFQKTPSYIKK